VDAGVRGVVVRAVEWLLPSDRADRVVYGVILVGALLAAESGAHETYAETIISAIGAITIYWLAHTYADVLSRRLTTHERLTVGALGRGLAREAALIRGAAIPVLVLLIAWASGAAQASAVNAALWSSVASLICFELVAANRAPATLPERALEVGVGLAIGMGILALKIVLH
jgi:TM2 domain-containing membrane protein YozV